MFAAISNDTAVVLSNGICRLATNVVVTPPVRALQSCGRACDTVLDGASVFTPAVSLSSIVERVTISYCARNARIAVAGGLRSVAVTACGWVLLAGGNLDSCLVAGNTGYDYSSVPPYAFGCVFLSHSCVAGPAAHTPGMHRRAVPS
ncbi:hypothetical protein GX586_11465 [bacterium]|nr:hypothetical protein [bacterium]